MRLGGRSGPKPVGVAAAHVIKACADFVTLPVLGVVFAVGAGPVFARREEGSRPEGRGNGAESD